MRPATQTVAGPHGREPLDAGVARARENERPLLGVGSSQELVSGPALLLAIYVANALVRDLLLRIEWVPLDELR